MKQATGEVLRCSFCNKSQRDVKKLIAGPKVYICDECVDICIDIIKEDGTTERSDLGTLPKGMIDAADKIIPGQAEAKRLLASAVIEHAARESSTIAMSNLAALLLAGPTGTGKNELVRFMV